MRTFQQTISARVDDWYNIHVFFADGTCSVFDFLPYINYPCYVPLEDREYFKKVEAAQGTLSWPSDIDIPSEAVWADTLRPSPFPR